MHGEDLEVRAHSWERLKQSSSFQHTLTLNARSGRLGEVRSYMLQARELRFDVKRIERRRKATTETKTLGYGKSSRDVRCNGGVCVFFFRLR